MNIINVITPYKLNGAWVFDDAERQLDKEPIGIDEMLDKVAGVMPSAVRGFNLAFSATPFPDYQFCLEWVRDESGGHIYRFAGANLQGWITPALLKYFEEPPKQLYIQAQRRAAGR